MKTQKIKPQYSQEHLLYLRRRKRDHAIVVISRIMLLLLLIGLWELAAQLKWIDPFIMSSPSRIANTIANLFSNGELFTHIGVTLYETCMGFLLSTLIGTLIAIVLWWSEYLRKVLDPYIVVLNSLPKIALGPIIILMASNVAAAIMSAASFSFLGFGVQPPTPEWGGHGRRVPAVHAAGAAPDHFPRPGHCGGGHEHQPDWRRPA